MPEHQNQQLIRFLSSPDRPEGTLNFQELQGFLFAVACSPEPIMPSEWLAQIFNEQDAVYTDMQEAQTVLQAIMELYNRINNQVFTADVGLPEEIDIKQNATENIGESADLGQWSRGFFIGHNWLMELWNEYTPEKLDEELGSSLMVLSFFSYLQLAEAYYKEIQPSEKSLEEFAGTMLKLFEDAMNSYAHMGRSIQTVLAEQTDPQQPYVSKNKVGRNDPCPCGSGRKYKKCCGAG